MSRAVLRVVMCGSVAPAFSSHFSAKPRAQATSLSNVSSLWGRSQFASWGSRPQETGLLRPTPRGSKPMRSYFRHTDSGSLSRISSGM